MAMRQSIGSAVLGCVAMAALGGCATPAEQEAEKGLQAFESCDLRSASQDFASAHNLDPARGDFALAYALSTIALLPEDPNVTAVVLKMGFTAPIDSSILRGQGGVLDQLAARDATCPSILNYIRTHLPYAPAQTNGPSAASVIADPTLSGTDFAAAAAALAPRLESLVAALEQGAGATTGFDIQGGCGVGSVHVEAPELYDARAVAEGGGPPDEYVL